jgi:long-subunit fatty acid transport protein
MSVVADTRHRRESLAFETHPEASGAKNINTFDLNFFSATLPLNLFRRNMVFSVGYQRLFDFNRHWQFLFTEEDTNADSHQYWDFEQEGSLSALGVSVCIQIIPQLAVGATFNRWEPGIGENRWEQNYSMTGSGTASGEKFITSLKKRESFSFSAVNANFGFYWRVADGFTLGGVVKTPVEGDVRHTYRREKTIRFPGYPPADQKDITAYGEDEELRIPATYGAGIAWDISDEMTLSADLQYTDWQRCTYTTDRGEVNAITGESAEESDVSSTLQARMGAEYRLKSPKGKYVIPARAGMFYDPAPAKNNPDDFFGVSLGLGLTRINRFSLDFAYQYRFGESTSLLPHHRLSNDVDEHSFYFSLIMYWYGKK